MVAAAVIGSAAIGAVASNSASNKAADASRDATNAARSASDRQAALAERQYEDYKSIYQPKELAAMDQASRISEAAEQRASKQFDFEYGNSQKYSDRYWKTQVPLEDSVIKDAMDYNTDTEQARQAGLAVTDNRDAFAQMRAMQDRDQQRRGINPSSGAALALANDAYASEALAGASAATKARFAAQQLGFAKKADAVALGKGLPGFSASSSQLAGGFNGTSMNAGTSGLAAVTTAAGSANNAAMTSGGLWGSSANSAGMGVNAFNSSLATQYRSPAMSTFGAIAGGASAYGFNALNSGKTGGFGFGGSGVTAGDSGYGNYASWGAAGFPG